MLVQQWPSPEADQIAFADCGQAHSAFPLGQSQALKEDLAEEQVW